MLNKYYMHSDEYRSLHNIFYNGAYFTIKEILELKNLSDKSKIDLIKKNL
jgi:hypothetical protein